MSNEGYLPDWLDRNEFDRAEGAGHRLWLYRRLRDQPSIRVLWVMCNPSTADDCKDDQTIQRVKCLSEAQGWHDIGVANLFTKREKHPRNLQCGDVGANDQCADWVLERAFSEYDIVVFAWGVGWSGWNVKNRMDYDARAGKVKEMARKAGIAALSFGVTKDGYPRHPRLLPCNSSPISLREARKR